MHCQREAYNIMGVVFPEIVVGVKEFGLENKVNDIHGVKEQSRSFDPLTPELIYRILNISLKLTICSKYIYDDK